jgi:heterodisulfide reductase subunit D
MTLSNLEKYRGELWLCARCGDCSLADKTVASKRDVFHPCAVKNVLGFEAYAARGRAMIMTDLLDGNLELSSDIADWAFTCTTCKNCQETCTATAEGILLPEMMEALRNDLVEAGFDLSKHREIEDSIVNQSNPYREPPEDRRSLFGDRAFPDTADTVYFVGCTSSYREKEIARTTVELLDRANTDFTVLPEEQCCGSVLLRLGRKRAFDDLTKKNIAAIQATNASTVVTACAGCYRTWKVDVPEVGHEYDFEVLHITEFLDRLIQEGQVSFESPKKLTVTYHDPCHLGRHAEVYEAPRRVIESVKNVQLVEMETNKRYAHCCGSGGGVKGSYGELADKIAADRIKEAEVTQADLLVTACPFCHRGLEDGAKSIGSKLSVLDLPQFLNSLLHEEGVSSTTESNPLKKQFMSYLEVHPKIFEGLKKDAIIDYIIESDRFHVRVLEKGEIEVAGHRAENPDVELTFSPGAVQVLTSIQSEDDYAAQFGLFFKEPTEETWIKFNLRRNIVKLLMKGYRRFAQKAGLI